MGQKEILFAALSVFLIPCRKNLPSRFLPYLLAPFQDISVILGYSMLAPEMIEDLPWTDPFVAQRTTRRLAGKTPNIFAQRTTNRLGSRLLC